MSAVHRLGDVVIGHKGEVDNCLLPAMDGQSRCYEHSEDRLIEDLFRGENCRFGGVNCTVQATACNEHDVPMCADCLSVYNRIQNGLRNAGVVTEGYHLADYQQINREMEGPEYAPMRAHYQQLAQRIDQPELLPPNHRWPQRPRHVTGNQQSMGSTYEGRTIGQLAGPHDQLIREATAPPVLPLVSRPREGTLRYNGRRMRNDELREAMERDMMNRAVVPLVPNPAAQPPPTGVHPTDMGHETDEELCECNNLEHSEFNEECPLNNVGEVCWGHGRPCDNYSVTHIEYHEDDAILDYGPVPLCNNCYRAWLRERIEGDERE